MNDASASDLAERRLAEAVKNYVPRVSTKWNKLVSLKEGIAELRHKRASYRTIAEILRNIDVPVSHMTVRRFCHAVLKMEPTAQRKHHTPRLSGALPKSHTQPDETTTTKLATRGPRVADPNNI